MEKLQFEELLQSKGNYIFNFLCCDKTPDFNIHTYYIISDELSKNQLLSMVTNTQLIGDIKNAPNNKINYTINLFEKKI